MEVVEFLVQPTTTYTQYHKVMAKGRGSKSTKLQAARDGTAPEKPQAVDSAKTKNVSDALRQAVKDLGGDDEDLDLIAGIDDSENEEELQPAKKGKKGDDNVDEVSRSGSIETRSLQTQGLKKALGDFMKGLDFKSVAPDAGVSDEEEEESEEEDDEEDVSDAETTGDDDEDEEENEEEEDEEEEEEDEEEEEESEEEAVPEVAAPARATERAKKAAEPKVEIDSTSGKVSCDYLKARSPHLYDRTSQQHPSGPTCCHLLAHLKLLSSPSLHSSFKDFDPKPTLSSKTYLHCPEPDHPRMPLSSRKSCSPVLIKISFRHLSLSFENRLFTL